MYVYLIQSGKAKNDPVKVGFSKKPEARLKALQTGNPKPLKLIMKIECKTEGHAKRLEKSLHEMLGKQNIHLEWFKLKKNHIIKMLNAFANNEEFDHVKHEEELNKHKSMTPEWSRRKLKKHIKEIEGSMKRRRAEAGFMYGVIYDNLGISTKEVKRMMNEELGSREEFLRDHMSTKHNPSLDKL